MLLFTDYVMIRLKLWNEKSKLTGVPLKNLNIKKGVLICCITRDDKLIIPGGDDVIFPGDSMIIVTTLLGLKDAQDILED